MLMIRHCMVFVLLENSLQHSLYLFKNRCLENGMTIKTKQD